MRQQGIGKQLSAFLYRHHLVLFVIIVIGSMSVVVFLINQSLINSTDTSDVTDSQVLNFDEKTIDKVNSLKSTGSQQPLHLPTDKRTNPFVE